MDWKNRQKNDEFIKLRDKMHVISRAYFKIEEINNKFNIIKRDGMILDLGAAPGGWCQYFLKYSCHITAIDLVPLKINEKIKFLQIDIYDETINFENYDLITSDMAPSTSGDNFMDSLASYELCDQALNIAIKYLKNNGNLVCKIFESENVNKFIMRCKEFFTNVQRFKPKSSRKESKEVFIICLNKKN